MFHRLLALPDDVKARYDTSSLKSALHGAAPCPVWVKQAMIEWWGPVFFEYYAATEGLGTVVDSATWLRRPGTVGLADPDHLHVGDEEAIRLPAGKEGLVWIKGAGTDRFEYFGDTDKTGGAYRGDHFTLGDVGLHRRGRLPLPHRPHRQPHHLRRREHLPGRGRRRAARAPGGGRRGRRHRRARRRVGRVGAGRRRAQARRRRRPDELLAFCRERLAHFKCPRPSTSSTTCRATTTARSTSGACVTTTGLAPRGRDERGPARPPQPHGGRPRPVVGLLHPLVRLRPAPGDLLRRHAVRPQRGRLRPRPAPWAPAVAPGTHRPLRVPHHRCGEVRSPRLASPGGGGGRLRRRTTSPAT